MAELKEYAANIQTTTRTDAAVEALKAKLLAQRKQTSDILTQNITVGILTQNRKMMEDMMKMGVVAGAGPMVPETKTPRPTHIFPVCNKRAVHAK